MKMVVVKKITRNGKGKHRFWNDAAMKFTAGLQTATLMPERDAKIFFEASIEDESVKLLPAKVILIKESNSIYDEELI